MKETCDKGPDVHRDIRPMSRHMSQSVSPFQAAHNQTQRASDQFVVGGTFSLVPVAVLGCQKYRRKVLKIKKKLQKNFKIFFFDIF